MAGNQMKYFILISAIVLSGCYSQPQTKPAVYIDWVFADDHAQFKIECLEQEQWQAECLADADKEYGIAGFTRDGVVYPCIHAKSKAEKKVCEG